MGSALELDLTRKEAWLLLSRFLSSSPAAAMALTVELTPRPEDWARVFVGESGARAREGYRALWSAPVAPGPKEGQTSLLVTAAQAAELQLDTERSRAFPGGYRRIAHHLAPDLVWVAWKYTRPGEHVGMAWDGLVRVDDHWAWFPKPYRVLAG